MDMVVLSHLFFITLGVPETGTGVLAEIKPMEPEPDHAGVGKRLYCMSVLRLISH